jgi:hypothetical protein
MLNLPKLILIVLLAAAAWYAWRQWDRRQKRKIDESERRTSLPVEEMERCRVCGTYVAAGRASSCGREDCPYRSRGG